MSILELKGVTKKFGSKTVLDNLSLSVPTGSIFGFVGENGAGKTTTMKMILGLEEITSGEIVINDLPVYFGDNQTNRLTGYLPDVPQFYDYMSGQEYLRFCGEITGFSKTKMDLKVTEILSLVGLKKDNLKIKGYSRGMKQRLGIAQALLNDPKLLICDEPTSALDPSGRNDFLEMLAALRGKMTILFSTHILSDVERICDYVGVLDQGKIVINGSLNDLKQQYAKKQIEIEFSKLEDLQKFVEKLSSHKDERIMKDYSCDFSNKILIMTYLQSYEEAAPLIFQLFQTYQVFPKTIKKIDPSLEKIFLEVVQ